MEQSLRLFFALEIPEETRCDLDKFGVTLERPWRPVPPERMHITLAFMEQVPETKLDEIIKVGEEAASAFNAFNVEISDTSCFPENGEPRVLYAKVNGGEHLNQLSEKLRGSLGELADQKKFKAHLTIARSRGGWARKILRKFKSGWPVENFVLLQSVLTDKEPRYELIKRFSLR